jgi:hypothetical protein
MDIYSTTKEYKKLLDLAPTLESVKKLQENQQLKNYIEEFNKFNREHATNKKMSYNLD